MKRLLFIVHRMPYPPDKGERLRAFQELKALSKYYRVTLATLAHTKNDYKAAAGVRSYCEKILVAPAGGKKGLIRGALGIFHGRSVTEGYFYNRNLENMLKNVSHGKEYPVAMAYSSSMLPYLLKVKAAHRIIDLVDVDSAKWYAYAEKASRLTKWIYKREGKLVRRLEEEAIINCDAVLLVSQSEADLLASYSNKLGPLSNGVDTDYFTAEEKVANNQPSLVFTGTMDYRPNIDGVCWFVENVWPQLKCQHPELIFYIVGRDPAPAVRRLAEQKDIVVTGTVPDVRPYLASAGIAICPLRIARGIQNKVLEAMAMGRAVVASGPALEGLDIEIGKEVIQADTPEEWHNNITGLLENDSLREDLGAQARECVLTKYNWDARMAPLVKLCHFLYEQYEQKVLEKERVKSKIPATAQKEQPKKKRRLAPVGWKETLLWFVTLLYIIFLTVVNLTPVREDGQGWLDKISPGMQNFLHIPAYSGLMILVTLAMCPTMRNRAVGISLAALCCFAFGVCMEYAQALVPGRTSHLTDMLRNGAGIILVLPILFFFLWRPTSRRVD